MSAWVSVEEQIPEDGLDVLAWAVDKFWVAYIDTFFGWRDSSTDARVEGELCSGPVTHWMPLPAPPEKP